jgi:hypothetical protein
MQTKYEEALQAVQDLRPAGVDADSQECDSLRNEIQKAKEYFEGTPPDQKLFTYQVSIDGQKHNFLERAPAHLARSNPPRAEGEAFLMQLVLKHTKEIQNAKRYNCSVCGNSNWRDITIRHCPISWLHSTIPFVLDTAQPVCKGLYGIPSRCDQEAKREFLEVMEEMSLPTRV